MPNLVLLLDPPDLNGGFGLWLFLSIGAIALFGIFLPLASWMVNRRREREAFYRSETLRRLAEASGDGANAAMEMLREDARLGRIKRIEGMKIGGLINVGLGISLLVFLRMLTGAHGPYLVGLIPGFIGLAMLVYVFYMAAPIE